MQIGNKQRALQALIECPSLTAAAEQAKVSRRTLFNYLSDEDFAREYQRQLQAQAIERAEELAAARARAIKVVESMMNDAAQPGAVRLQAAKQLLAEAAAAQDRVDGISKSMSFEAKWLF